MDPVTIDPEAERVGWTWQDRPISVPTSAPQLGAAYPDAGVVLVLCGAGRNADLLLGFTLDGRPRFEVPAPEGCAFYYPSRHPGAPVAVVCLCEDAPTGFDVRFGVDPETGALEWLGLAR